MKTIIFIVITLFFLTLAAQGQTLTAHPNKTPIGIYPYWELRPDSAETLLFFFHGHSERGNGSYTVSSTGVASGELLRVLNIGTAKLIKAGQFKFKQFITVMPQYGITSDYCFPSTLKSFVDAARKYYGVSKVCMIGISGGGITVSKYIETYPGDVESCVIISGAADPAYAYKAIGTRVWIVHGEDDEIFKLHLTALPWIASYNAAAIPKGLAPVRQDLQPNYKHEAGVWDRACQMDKYYLFLLNKSLF